MKFDFLSESDQAYFIHKASTLVEALPYIRQQSGNIIVIKYVIVILWILFIKIFLKTLNLLKSKIIKLFYFYL